VAKQEVSEVSFVGPFKVTTTFSVPEINSLDDDEVKVPNLAAFPYPVITQDYLFIRNAKETKTFAVHSVLSEAVYLKPEERLYIAYPFLQKTDRFTDIAADLYESIGCLREALPTIIKQDRPRKIGDIYFQLGEFEKAIACYSRKKAKIISRNGPDTDRLLLTYLIRRDWVRILDAIQNSEIERIDNNNIIFGSGIKNPKPILKIVAIAIAKSGLPDFDNILNRVMRDVGWNRIEFLHTIEWARTLSDNDLVSEQYKLTPKSLRKPIRTIAEALAIGNTERAKHIRAWIENASVSFAGAYQNLMRWLDKGDEASLEKMSAWLLGGEIPSCVKTAFFYLIGCKGGLTSHLVQPNPPRDRIRKLYEQDWRIMRIGFGEYIWCKLVDNLHIDTQDLLTAVFRHLYDAFAENYQTLKDAKFGMPQLQSNLGWAEARLTEWLASEKAKALVVSATQAALSIGNDHSKATNTVQWKELAAAAYKVLSTLYLEDIGQATWVSEEMTFKTVKRAFKGHQVERHAQPLWLFPQHLDVFISDIDLAIEYMGLQHYEPVDIFGGAVGFAATVARDRKKKDLCEKAGIRLCMSSEHFGRLAWQFKRVSGSFGLKVQAAIAC
jgi:tetratricopeptide (TPR) repeat protein